MNFMIRTVVALLLAFTSLMATQLHAQERFITVASTTSTENSGLYEFLLPRFTAESGIDVRVVAVGTGQAIRLARNGDADVLLVHHRESEQQFVEEGFGEQRFDLMYNDFVIVGPLADPAGVRSLKDAVAALRSIAGKSQLFVSRGDDSGTHKMELGLWRAAGIKPDIDGVDWYRETGSGMGRTLNVASGLDAYSLTDRATWMKFKNKGSLELLVEGDQRLFNQYGIILVSTEKHPHIKTEEGQRFIDWMLSPQGQNAINAYQISGQQAFFANARQ